MCHEKECLTPPHQSEQVKNNRVTLAGSRMLPSTACCLSCHVFSALFVLSIVCSQSRGQYICIYRYTGTINVKMLKVSFVSKELEHFVAFFPQAQQ